MRIEDLIKSGIPLFVIQEINKFGTLNMIFLATIDGTEELINIVSWTNSLVNLVEFFESKWLYINQVCFFTWKTNISQRLVDNLFRFSRFESFCNIPDWDETLCWYHVPLRVWELLSSRTKQITLTSVSSSAFSDSPLDKHCLFCCCLSTGVSHFSKPTQF